MHVVIFDRDVAAIALATASMGDYKLKSSPDYEVRLFRTKTYHREDFDSSS